MERKEVARSLSLAVLPKRYGTDSDSPIERARVEACVLRDSVTFRIWKSFLST